MMLPHVVGFNELAVGALYRELYPSALNERIIELKTAARLAERLRDFNIDRVDLPNLAKEAAAQWTGEFNPRQVGEAELLELYEAAY